MRSSELKQILASHAAYLGGQPEGRRADLSKADLSGADLAGVQLGAADLTEANLGGANLSGASLRGANLTDAYLVGADLGGADLTYANLTGAIFDPPESDPDVAAARALARALADDYLISCAIAGVPAEFASTARAVYDAFGRGVIYPKLQWETLAVHLRRAIAEIAARPTEGDERSREVARSTKWLHDRMVQLILESANGTKKTE